VHNVNNINLPDANLFIFHRNYFVIKNKYLTYIIHDYRICVLKNSLAVCEIYQCSLEKLVFEINPRYVFLEEGHSLDLWQPWKITTNGLVFCITKTKIQ